jgi:hypothetical protein
VAGTIGPGALGWLTAHFFSDDRAVRSSAVIVGIVAAILGVLSFGLGLRSYKRAAEENMAGS